MNSPTDISRLPTSPEGYAKILEYLNSSDIHPDDKAHLFIDSAQRDFWFFARFATRARSFFCEKKGCEYYAQPIFDHPFIFARCRAVQSAPDGFLDLWPRGHLKTTIITSYLSLWDFIARPDNTVAIVTWKLQDVGDAFVESIKVEMETADLADNPFARLPKGVAAPKTNAVLSYHWPEIFWQDPKRESPVWRQGQFNLKGHSGVRENSISVMGLNAMKTSMHFRTIVYDDIVTDASSSSPDACADCTVKFQKTVGMWHTTQETIIRAVATRWAVEDTSGYILDKGILKRRAGPENCYGEDGESVFHPGSNWLAKWEIALGDVLFAANMQNKCVNEQSLFSFRTVWLDNRRYADSPEDRADGANLYAFVDPARMKGGGRATCKSDYTAIIILALRSDGKKYVVEMMRDRIDLERMVNLVFDMDAYWRSRGNPIIYWWWESRGASLDVDYWELQARVKKNAAIEFLRYDDNTEKDSRIQRLLLPFEKGDIWIPRQMIRDVDGGQRDMTQVFVQEEYRVWRPRDSAYRRPDTFSRNEDLLDALAQHMSPEVARLMDFPVDDSPKTWESLAAVTDLKRQRRNVGRAASGERSAWAC